MKSPFSMLSRQMMSPEARETVPCSRAQAQQLADVEEVPGLLKLPAGEVRRLHHGAVGRGKLLQADLPRLHLLGQPGGVHGGLEQAAHRLQPPPLFGQLGLLLLQQGQQRLGAAAGEIVPDLRQGVPRRRRAAMRS